jgi:hypothetical protein
MPYVTILARRAADGDDLAPLRHIPLFIPRGKERDEAWRRRKEEEEACAI